MTKILIVPGLSNSGPDHWQSHWERRLQGAERVQQRDFDNPICSEWVENIEAAVQAHGPDVVLVGHSCGSIAIAHWAATHPRKITGAMLVAPSDVEMEGFPFNPEGFKPIPKARFSFASIVVASSKDPYARLERAEAFARSWGAELVNVGEAGHINTASGHGEWAEGLEILRKLTG